MSTTKNNNNLLKFHPFSSTVEPSFWLSLSKLKLHSLKLNEDPVPIQGSFSITPPTIRNSKDSGSNNSSVGGLVRIRLDQSSLSSLDTNATKDCTIQNEVRILPGKVLVVNTKEGFKQCDKNEFISTHGVPPLQEEGGEEEAVLAKLASFLVLTYMNLKDHSIVYWFAFPALTPKSGKAISYISQQPPQLLQQIWSQGQMENLHEEYHKLRMLQLQTAIQEKEKKAAYKGCPLYFIIASQEDKIQCHALSYQTFVNLTNEGNHNVMFGFLDATPSSSSSQQQQAPPMGWILRNYIAYLSIKYKLGGMNVQIVSFKPKMLRRIPLDLLNEKENESATLKKKELYSEDGGSFLLNVTVPHANDYQWPSASNTTDTTATTKQHAYKCVGWELNARSKPGPRFLNLTPLLSPTHLAVQAMDLNLRLMKWRMIPSLNLDKLSSTKTLLLGAGTLGCAVARTLLGWGIKNITLVDNGKVSYSNPARQSLFTLADCENGGKDKANAAALALQQIAGPTIQSSGVNLTIPMPGHDFTSTPDEEATVQKDIETLVNLVEQSDVIFLLTDTRESRWLPALLARSYSKMLINAALGFDSWLVMRHGLSTCTSTKSRLGCYFCSDIVAPENSMKDRTLDQQCTVTRPGLANIAASMAVELMVSLLHHEDGVDAPAPAPSTTSTSYSPGIGAQNDNVSSPLGIMPHQIRGSLTSYTLMTPTIPAFQCCTACSDAVVDAYKKDGYEFVKKACCSDSTFLKDVSGLSAFQEEAAAKMEAFMEEEDDWDLEDEE
uniref:Autophagy-related protein 7 n=1 Tax=Ditylum brightwellii TaxID=49249 RepID=A0A7S4RRR7_9STRA